MDPNVPKGQRFSHIYARPDEAVSDSLKLRRRIHKTIVSFSSRSVEAIGQYVDQELGLHYGTDYSYRWPEATHQTDLNDFLDLITLFWKGLQRYGDKERDTSRFRNEVDRIFTEEHTPYQIDELGGIHPFVDEATKAVWQSAVRGLGSEQFNAARSYLDVADKALLSGDGRSAIRAIFDAAENVFKQLTGERQLAYKQIENSLKLLVEKYFSADETLKQSSRKILGSFKAWVDACHDYRHEAGQPEIPQPDEVHAILLVTEGLSFVRWLAEIAKRKNSEENLKEIFN